MQRNIVACLAAIAAGLTLTFSAATADTVTVIDTMDRKVEVRVPVQRVLLGFYFEDFYAIVGPSAYDRVVAISRPVWQGWRSSQYAAYVAQAPRIDQLVDIGDIGAGAFNIEAAITVKPDVAIIAAWQYTGMGEAVAKLEAAGIPVVVVDYNAQTLDKHLASTLLIGKVMGTEERARKIAAEYKAAVADVQTRIARAGGEPKRVYVELGNKGPGEYGNSYGKGMWGGVVALAGGQNIALGKVENWGPLSPEYVLSQNPDVVIVPGSDWIGKPKAVLMGFGVTADITRERLRPYTARPGWSGIAAVRKGEVHALYHGGTRTIYDYVYLQYIAKTLYPEAFADVDPVTNLRRYYDAWLPIKADGVFMVKLD